MGQRLPVGIGFGIGQNLRYAGLFRRPMPSLSKNGRSDRFQEETARPYNPGFLQSSLSGLQNSNRNQKLRRLYLPRRTASVERPGVTRPALHLILLFAVAGSEFYRSGAQQVGP